MIDPRVPLFTTYNVVRACRHLNLDPYKVLAAMKFRIPFKDVFPAQRTKAKIDFYTSIYCSKSDFFSDSYPIY